MKGDVPQTQFILMCGPKCRPFHLKYCSESPSWNPKCATCSRQERPPDRRREHLDDPIRRRQQEIGATSRLTPAWVCSSAIGRGSAILDGARLHDGGRPHARPWHRRHHGHLHAHPRGDAALAARRRPVAPVPQVTACLLRAGRPAGSIRGMFSFSLYERLKAATPEFEEVTAFQAGGARLTSQASGCRHGARPCAPGTSPATTFRRSASACSAAGSSPRRTTREHRPSR